MSTLAEQITQQLRDWISQGKVRPGEKLEEIPLAEKLGASRTPIRSALQTLASEGLLEHRPKRGYTVKEFNLAEIMSAYEARAALEGVASRRAAQNGLSAAQAETLQRCLEVGDRILANRRCAAEDELEYQQMNMDLHQILVLAADSPQVQRFIEQINNSIPQAASRVVRWELDIEILRRSHEDHHRIVDAVLSRDGRRAEVLMHEHVYFAGLLFRKSHLGE